MWDILKKATVFFANYGGQERHWSERLPDTVRFRFVEEHKGAFATDCLCHVIPPYSSKAEGIGCVRLKAL